MSTRIAEAFARMKQEHRTGVMPYVTIGHPSIEATLEIVPALEAAGADVVELGIPFSDPLADGPTVQASTFHALQQGVTPAKSLQACKALRQRGVKIPLIFMLYFNPILSYGLDKFAKDSADAGADGVIVPDLPMEEAREFQAALAKHGLSLIPMVAPTSTEERVAQVLAETKDGFIYCVSVVGVTGTRTEVNTLVFDLIARIRRHTKLPVAVGFGVSERRHVETLGQHADAVIVGSALVNVIGSATPSERVKRVQQFMGQLTGRPQPV